MKWKQQKFEITKAFPDKDESWKVKVDGEVEDRGLIGRHQEFGNWTLSHIPTGYLISRGLRDRTECSMVARRFLNAECIESTNPTDFKGLNLKELGLKKLKPSAFFDCGLRVIK